MTDKQFKAMEKLWNNDCRVGFPTAENILHKIVGKPMAQSLIEDNFLAEVPTHPQADTRRFNMTALGENKLWEEAQKRCQL